MAVRLWFDSRSGHILGEGLVLFRKGILAIVFIYIAHLENRGKAFRKRAKCPSSMKWIVTLDFAAGVLVVSS